MRIDIRPFRDSDAEDLSRLCKLLIDSAYPSLRRSSEPEYYLWRRNENPAGKGAIFLAVANDKLVGCFGCTPKRVRCNKQTWLAAEINDAFVLGDYQGLGLFRRLIERAFDWAKAEGVQFLYGTPNSTVLPIYVQKMGFQVAKGCDIRLLVSPVFPWYKTDLRTRPFTAGDLTTDYVQRQNDPFSEASAASLPDWDKAFEIIHDLEYLHWRFIAGPDHYEILDNVAVVKTGTWGPLRVGYLADLLKGRAERNQWFLWLQRARQHFRSQRLHLAAGWLDLRRLPCATVLSRGWVPYRKKPIILKAVDDNFVPELVSEWVFGMADSDNI